MIQFSVSFFRVILHHQTKQINSILKTIYIFFSDYFPVLPVQKKKKEQKKKKKTKKRQKRKKKQQQIQTNLGGFKE
jgi:hypothetical protein